MCRVLIVEDEIFVAMEMEYIVEQMGLRPAGIAADTQTALALGDQADIAIVDVNLRDGRTGCAIGRQLTSRFGVTVLFLTANPALVGEGHPGAVGVLSKPVSENELVAAIAFATQQRIDGDGLPPKGLHVFPQRASRPALPLS